jgi:hypothetical protein
MTDHSSTPADAAPTVSTEESVEVDSAKQNLVETMEDLGASPEVIDAVRGPVAVSEEPRLRVVAGAVGQAAGGVVGRVAAVGHHLLGN